MLIKINSKLLGLGLLFSLVAAPLAAEVETNIKYDYYTVQVEAQATVAKAALAASPIYLNGHQYLGYASCNLKYNYLPEQNAEDCRLNTYKVSSDCTITLPRFVGGEALLQQALANFTEKLKERELDRSRVSAEYAAKYDQVLANFGQHKCGDFPDKMQKAFDAAVSEFQAAQRQYDEKGLPGQTKGADLEVFLSDPAQMPLWSEVPASPEASLPGGNPAGTYNPSGNDTGTGLETYDPYGGGPEEKMEDLSDLYR